MQKFSALITGMASATFMFAAMYNAQLTWNADKFYAPTLEQVTLEGRTYSINSEYNGVLKDRHTDKLTKNYSERGHLTNVKALSDFFAIVK